MNAVSNGALARNVRRLGHLDLAGAGQVTVAGRYAYVGHIPNRANLGTTILDVSDPANPRTVATITLADTTSHSHKARVAGDIMIVNHERNPTAIGRRADELPRVRAQLAAALGREPTRAELAQKLSVTEDAIGEIEAEAKRGYHNGGFKIYDVSKPAQPKEIVHHRTGGIGVHRFDMDERYAYISTEMEGYVGNILVIYDIRDPQRPAEVSRWWMPGQHIAGGETPSWPGRQHRLHHALRYGDEMWASCWHGGFSIVDVSDLGQAEDGRHLQLSSAVSGADPHGAAGAGAARRAAHRALHRRGGPGPERERGGGAARTGACLHSDLRRDRRRPPSSRWRNSR